MFSTILEKHILFLDLILEKKTTATKEKETRITRS